MTLSGKAIEARVLPVLRDPASGAVLRVDGDHLVSDRARFPIVRGVPRFVPHDHYVA
jgi:hypothetical protein